MKTTTMKLSELVLDFDIYPRARVDSTHVGHLKDAIEADEELPPLIADQKSKRVVDGFHRYKAFLSINGQDAEVVVELRSYETEADLFAEAMRLNARHGNALSPWDRVRCIDQGEKLGLTVEQISGALGLTIARVGEIRLARAASGTNGKNVVLKRTASHLSGKKITKKQIEANEKAGGMNAAFYVNQVINLIEGDLVDWDNDYLAQRLTELKRLIGKMDIVIARQKAVS